MRKKKVLVHGTSDSVKKFFEDALSWDYEVVAILSESFEKVSIVRGGKDLAVLPSQSLPSFIQKLVDAVIITDYATKDPAINFFFKLGFDFCRIILWSAQNGWEKLEIQDPDGTRVVFLNGLEFHINDKADERFFNMIQGQLKIQRMTRNLEPEEYSKRVAKEFERMRKRPLDFNNVHTFSEKVNWIKVFDATPLKGRLADKYAVRGWVADKIGSEYLIPLLGVWEDFDDINFDDLPNQFVLKCNHSWNTNIIVRDKKTFNTQKAREKINAWLSVDHAALGYEMHYTLIKPKIFAEEFMRNGDALDLNDYKFYCFDGKIFCCQYMINRSGGLKMEHFDNNWQVMKIEKVGQRHIDNPERIPKPKNFELMKTLVAKLATGFAFVRVDLYEIEGHVYFGEMTFTPSCGHFSYKSEGTDEYLGSLLKLPEITPPLRCLENERMKNFFSRTVLRARVFFVILGKILGEFYVEKS